MGTQFDVASSQTAFGLKNITVDNALVQDRSFLENLAKTITVERKDGRDRLDLTLTNEFPDVLFNNPGLVAAVVNEFSNYSALWQIRGTDHELSLASGLRHSVKYSTEAYDVLPFLVLDDPVMGVLDNGRFLAI